MNKRNSLLATFGIKVFLVAMLLSCSGWQKGKRGINIGDDLFVLDTDTFRLQHYSANDSMLFLSPINNIDITIIVKQGVDSLYYLFKGEYTSPVYDTEDFVLVNHFYIYDLVNKKKYQLPFKSIYDYGNEIYYLGDWNEKHIFSIPIHGFANSEALYFTDGTLIPLCEDAHALHIEQDGKIKIERRGLSITMDIDELHNYKSIEEMRQDVIDGDMEIIHEWCEEPRPDLISADLGVHIEVPRGNTKTDKVIKKYFFQAICDDIFRLLDYDSKRLYSLSSIKSGDIRNALSQAAKVWRKEVRKRFSACDDMDSGFTGFSYSIDVYKVAETDNYVTYYYELDEGISPGHDHPLYYYLTYDKRRDVIVNANNTIKKGMISTFKERVPKWVNQQYEIWSHNGKLGGTYPCDEAGGCYSTTEGELHFPLPHFSIVPDGVTISFHTDQIDCCSAGNHLILIPKGDIQDLLEYDYWTNDKVTQPLSYFIDKKENYYYGMTNYDEN